MEVLVCDGCEQRILSDNYRAVEVIVVVPSDAMSDHELTLHVHTAAGYEQCRELVGLKVQEFVNKHVPAPASKGKKKA
jgi:hypothetical protein